MYECEACVRSVRACESETEKYADIWVFDSILVLLKSVLIFHHWGFYGTDSIHEKSDGQSYFSSTKMFVMCKEKDRTL